MFRKEQEIGQYKLIQKLGEGGFGEVWLAEKQIGNTLSKFAIKFPRKNKIIWKKVLQEIGLWVIAGKHPNVLSFEEAKNLLEPDELKGQIMIVSEFIQNGSLKDIIEPKNSPQIKLDIKKAVKIIIDTLSGLNHLHLSGIIHHDIKPANILIKGETAVLADFGISRIITQTDITLSQTIFGTPAYMAPEARLGTRNEQTDIWSVGITLYELIMGNRPFSSENPDKIIWNNEIPKDLRKIIEKSLNPISDLRYKTSQEMLTKLESFLNEFNSKNISDMDLSELETEEDISKETVWKLRDYAFIKKAIKEISSQTSQVDILKSLLRHLEYFVPRGIFFIVKNEQFVGWKTFGKNVTHSSKIISEIFFSVIESSILAESYKSHSTESAIFGQYNDFSLYLSKLEYEKPSKMYSVPLIARGKVVAVLYVDIGNNNSPANIDAVESLVDVAGLTVEILAAGRLNFIVNDNKGEKLKDISGIKENEGSSIIENVSEEIYKPLESKEDKSRKTILLADDSETVQKVIQITFELEEMDVITVGDGNSAMKKIAEFMPDLVMADIYMPGLNGYEVCKKIKENKETRKIPVILLAGTFEAIDEDEVRRVGADDVLIKPFQSIRSLVKKVFNLINSR